VLTRRARLPIEYAQAAATHSVVANLEAQAQDAAPRSPTPPEQEQAEEEEDMAEESDDVRLLFERARRLGLTRALRTSSSSSSRARRCSTTGAASPLSYRRA
jgi:hypothetical protein